LMVRLKRHVPDGRLLRLINRYLKAGVRVGSQTQATTMGVPQGGPLTVAGACQRGARRRVRQPGEL
jgi:hypothetical protein